MTELTESLLIKLEEKIVSLVTELEDTRQELSNIRQENTALKLEKENNTRKLTDLVDLLDSVGATVEPEHARYEEPARPALVQA